MITVGQMIREAREKVGISQQKLADSLGLASDSQINRIETGTEKIAYYHIRKVALTLRMDFMMLRDAWLNELEAKPRSRGRRA